MGRLQHIRETVIRNIEDNKNYGNVEFVLLNYNSPDRLDEWVQSYCRRYIELGLLSYYRTTEPKFFHMSHAKNVAHLLAKNDIVCNLDGDNFTGRDYAEHLNEIFVNNPRSCVRCIGGDSGSGGRITLMRDEFVDMGGYEEKMMGWGLEDADLWQRTKRRGLTSTFSHGRFCKCIEHDHDMREKFHTPPGEIRMDIGQTKSKNNVLYNQARRARRLTANDNFVWGKTTCIQNFTKTIYVGSNVDNGRKEPFASREPTILPLSVLFPSQLPEQKAAVKSSGPPRVAGKFTISKLMTHQVNEKVI